MKADDLFCWDIEEKEAAVGEPMGLREGYPPGWSEAPESKDDGVAERREEFRKHLERQGKSGGVASDDQPKPKQGEKKKDVAEPKVAVADKSTPKKASKEEEVKEKKVKPEVKPSPSDPTRSEAPEKPRGW